MPPVWRNPLALVEKGCASRTSLVRMRRYGTEDLAMAVLFADLTNSTALCRKLGDAAAREVIALAFEATTDLLPNSRRMPGEDAGRRGDVRVHGA